MSVNQHRATGILMLFGALLTTATASTTSYKRDVPSALAAEATVSEQIAYETALKRIKHGKIVALELEREDSILLYSIDVRVAGKSGIEEVHVSATDGSVLSVVRESAQDERAEAAKDRTETAAK
jgi:uncharacterized membrane protein YkoI